MYGDAFAQPPYRDPDRGREVKNRLRDSHCKRPSYRGLVAIEDEHVIGMCYGYHGAPGQWWHDTVRIALGKAVAKEWLADSYELVEIAVAPKHQGRGVGEALIAALLEGRPEKACVLSTRTDSRAHELYRRLGFELIREMPFAPAGAPFYVMGKRLR
ncbi:MAG: GNAT family N-acetyltransferase [Dehalococcoidia bacterium]|nr:GNAT family N-acetyltransferase [Dehalococcoidia bacterium]